MNVVVLAVVIGAAVIWLVFFLLGAGSGSGVLFKILSMSLTPSASYRS